MIIPEEITQKVINGLILDSNGCWRTIEDSLIKESTEKNNTEDSSTIHSKKRSKLPAAQTGAYHNKETDRLDTEILKTEVVLARKPKSVLAHPESKHRDDSAPKQTEPVESDDLDTKQLRIKPSKPEAPDTKLIKLNKDDIDEFIEEIPRNDLEDASELDSVFSDIMSELDVFSNVEESGAQEQSTMDKAKLLTQDKKTEKVPEKKQNIDIRTSVTENDSKSPQTDVSPPPKVLNDWDKARSKSGKIVLYLSAAGALIAGAVILLQMLF